MALGVAMASFAYSRHMGSSLHMGFFAGRIIFFDYLIFFIGWICGWNAASRWRGRQGVIEELVVTNLRPGVVGNILFAGSMGIWVRLLVLLVILEAVALGFKIYQSADVANSPASNYPKWILLSGLPPLLALYSALIAWFHLETLRIAYWMFAVAALPQVNLLQKAIANFFLIILYVGALTLVGISISGMSGLFVLAIRGAIMSDLDKGFADPVVWMIGALPGLFVVGFLKRQITNLYETDFWKHYLCFTWWGAGEKQFPAFYPLTMLQNVNAWIGVLRLEERQELARQRFPHAAVPTPMQPAQRPVLSGAATTPAGPVLSSPAPAAGPPPPGMMPPPIPSAPTPPSPSLAVNQTTGAPVPPSVSPNPSSPQDPQ